MTTSPRTPEILLAVLLTTAVALTGCGQDEEHDHARDIDDPAHAPRARDGSLKNERALTDEETDTLRVWKARLGITRDEYWEERGGVLGNDWAEFWYPPGKITVSHAMYGFKQVDAARKRARQVFGTVPSQPLTLGFAVSMSSFTRRTGQQWWHYSLLADDRIEYQPVSILFQRGLGVVATQREFYRWVIRRLADGRAPLWLEHGFASVLSDEGQILRDNLTEFPDDPVVMSVKKVNSAIEKNDVKKDSRLAYFNAYKMTRRITDRHGVEALGAMVAAIGDGGSIEDASKKHMGLPWSEVVEDALAWSEDWSR